MRLNEQDKQILMAWLHSTTTTREHEIFTKLGYNSARRIMLTIVNYCPKNTGKEDKL